MGNLDPEYFHHLFRITILYFFVFGISGENFEMTSVGGGADAA